MTSPNSLKFFKAAAIVGAAFVSSIVARANGINFDTGTAGNSVGSFYAGQGVVFQNATFTSNFGLAGSSGPLGIIATNNGAVSNQYEWDQAHAVVALFAGGASSVGITGIDVGDEGFRIDAYDSLVGGSLVDFDQAFGTGAGVGLFFNLSTTSAAIMRVEMYQITGVGNGEGIVLDNLTYTSSVPELGSTFALFVGALLPIVAMRRRKVA